jgi:hypothetical protein
VARVIYLAQEGRYLCSQFDIGAGVTQILAWELSSHSGASLKTTAGTQPLNTYSSFLIKPAKPTDGLALMV